MNRHEKIAWFNLAIITISLLLFCTLFYTSRTLLPFTIGLKYSFAAFALIGFIGLGPALFKKRSGKESTSVDAPDGSETLRYDAELDERDMLIQRRVQMHGFSAFWIVFVVITMVAWIYLRSTRSAGIGAGAVFITVDVDLLPLMLFPGAIILIAASSLSTIMQYRSKAFNENSFESGAGPDRKTIVNTLAFFLFFIAFSISLVSHGDWMFAVKFLMVVFAAAHLTFRSLRYKTVNNYSEIDIRMMMIAEWAVCVLFLVFFIALIASIIVEFQGSLNMWVIAPRLFIVGFGTMIFLLSILKYGNNHHRGRRHEKT